MNQNIRASLIKIDLSDENPIVCDQYTNKYKTIQEIHYHDCTEIGLCVSGNGIFFVNNEILLFDENSISIIPPFVPHIAQSTDNSPSKWFFLFISENLFKITDNKKYIFNDDFCASIIQKITEELIQKKEHYLTIIADFLQFLQIFMERSHNVSERKIHEEYYLIAPALTYISQNYQKIQYVKELAEMCFLSEGYFRKIFKKSIGSTPAQYINKIKLTKACFSLTTSGKTMINIALECGFNDISVFNRLFKKEFGLSPKGYRKQYKEYNK